MTKRFSDRSLWRCLLCGAFCLAASCGWSQVLFYATSSATLTNNTVDYIWTSGSPSGSILTAGGVTNGVFRCSAIALDPLAQKAFLLDAQSNRIWSINLDGTGLAFVTDVGPGTPTDLALDAVNQQIYFTTSSYEQVSNTIQRVNYSGSGDTVLFTAGGASSNGVSRCTALALDLVHSQILFSDAGSNALWSLPLGGGSVASSVVSNLPGAPLDLALDVTNELIYYVTSSTIETNNTVQSVDYGGLTNRLLHMAGGEGGIHRCTALEFDPVASKLYVADAGANRLWSLNPDGSGLATVEGGVLSSLRRVRLLPATAFMVFTLNDSGPGSLRQAILDSHIFSSIVFSNGLFSSNTGVVQLSTVGDTTFGPSALMITNSISIAGPVGSNGIVIARSNGAPAMRLFYVAPGGSLTLSNVTLTNGLSEGGVGGSGRQRGGSGGGGGGMGGAIFNYGTLALINDTLVGNEALGGEGGGPTGGAGEGSGGGGGGIGGDGGSGGEGSAGGNGGGPAGGIGGTGTGGGGEGGIASGGGGGGSGLKGDGSGPGGDGGFGGGGGGGGAYDTTGKGGGAGGMGGTGGFGGGGSGGGGGTPGGTMGGPGFGGGAGGATGDNSGNVGSAGGGGAGLGGAVFNVLGVMGITNCTFSSNLAVGGVGGSIYPTTTTPSFGFNGMGLGGGILNVDGSVDVLNCTFAYNQADQGGGGICNVGEGESSSVFIRNTILADTLSGASDYFSTNVIFATNMDLGNNDLIQVNHGFDGGIVSTADPRLTPLQDNGGPTWTYALMNGSPAIDAGDNTDLPETDQRGYPRIVDGDGNGSAIVDLGAVEDGLVSFGSVPQTAQEIALNGFEFSFTGEPNRTYVIEDSTDLVNWNIIGTILVSPWGVATFYDTTATGTSGNRYYRAYALP